MDKIIINGGKRLSGTVSISGAKNAVLPIMTAALLAQGKTILERVPDLRDTRTMQRLLAMIGAGVAYQDGRMTIDAAGDLTPEAPYDLVKTMRASFYVLGPLISRCGIAKVSLPGGCAWGPRPVNFHIEALKKLGASIDLEGGYIIAKSPRLTGTRIRFDIPSVGATGNVLMAAATARGETVIENAAREPEIVQLGEFLNLMGAEISGLGTTTLNVQGVDIDSLRPVGMKIIPDRIEAGTFLIAGAALGNVTIQDVIPEHLSAVLDKLESTGATIGIENYDITVTAPDKLQPMDMTTDVYPGFATDLQAQWIALMTVADGSSVITDTIYHDRFSHVPELNRLGCRINVENNVAFIRGVERLEGAPVMSTDIRASASLIIAGLIAQNRTEVSRVYHIDRGYEKIEEKFKGLGADIWRESE
ncbi:MAG: UDP-N-acetylglucosamine 1-carboxyvinyltransferase [Fidelibacterota bacterium]